MGKKGYKGKQFVLGHLVLLLWLSLHTCPSVTAHLTMPTLCYKYLSLINTKHLVNRGQEAVTGTREKTELKSGFQKQGRDAKLDPGTASLSAKRAGGIVYLRFRIYCKYLAH